MSSSKFRIVQILSLALLIAMLFGLGSSVVATPPSQEGGLFADVAVQGEGDLSDDPKIVRARFVEPNFEMLGGVGDTPAADTLELNLFDDVTFTAVLDRAESNRSGSLSWMGHLASVEYGTVILVIRDGVMVASVKMPGAFYQIRYVENGVHAIQEMNEAAFPPEPEPIPAVVPGDALVEGPYLPMADDGSVIDVLVVYTDDARAAVGGTTAMENLIDLAVAETNTSYANSGVTQRVNLVHAAEVSYDESSFNWSVTLGRLTSTSDGYMDNVHTLRDTYCADEVVLLVNDTDYCGLAWLMMSVSTSFASNAFALVSWTCATGYYSFGHEMGHNMGARHDWYVDSDTTPYAYNHGYVNATDQWRTVMAYNTECSDQGFNCTRLQYWSNPSVLYGGDPMGVPAGTSTSCSEGVSNPNCDADNQLLLDNTAYTVSNFRDSSMCAPPVPGPLAYHNRTVDDDTSGDSSGDSNSIINCGESIELYVDLYNHGNATVTGINATISSSDPYITFTSNTISSYPDISSLGTDDNNDDFEFDVSPNVPQGHVIDFDLGITASNGGPWSDDFRILMFCGPLDNKIYLPVLLRSYWTATWVTILSEDFEGDFPGSTWTVHDNDSTSGNYYWGKRDCKSNGGSYSVWNAGAGDTTIACGNTYQNDMFSWMIYGPFSLADATAAELIFDWWSNTEDGFDQFFWGASTNGTNYYGTQVSGSYASWTVDETFDLSAVPTLGDLTGENQVWIAFVFASDVSITYDGSFVDNVLLHKLVGGSASSQSSPSLERTLQPNQTMKFVEMQLP